MNEKKVAFITGAGQGIGRGIALELSRAGFDIAGNDLIFDPAEKDKGLAEVKIQVERLGGRFLPVAGDISELGEHDKMLALIRDNYGRIDVLVNNAGVAPEKRRDILEVTPAGYDRIMAINARSAFFLTQKMVGFMLAEKGLEQKPGRCVIFISSVSAVVSSVQRAEYCISKAALSQIARVYAARLAGAGINVYEIRPGIIQTDMTAPVREKYDRLISEGLVPQGRWGFPQDVGKAAAALARGDLAYSTGLILEVSGGMDIRNL